MREIRGVQSADRTGLFPVAPFGGWVEATDRLLPLREQQEIVGGGPRSEGEYQPLQASEERRQLGFDPRNIAACAVATQCIIGAW